MRKLATVQVISDIQPIENADAIEVATIKGWKVVIKKDEFKVGERVVYLEIDSWVPHELAPFLSKGKTPREFNGIPGERLRTVKLRGQISQGLILPLHSELSEFETGSEVSEQLGIIKWEMEIPKSLGGQVKGAFPSFISKTDQERVQNIFDEIPRDTFFQVTEKLEGSSSTTYFNNGEFGVCSRNLELKYTEDNAFWEVVKRLNIEYKMRTLGKNIAIQCELVGPKVQGNIYKLSQLELYLYDVWNIDTQCHVHPIEATEVADILGIPHVPIIGTMSVASLTLDEILEMADGKSEIGKHPLREGIVFKSLGADRFSFKAISNKYLLGEK